MLIMPAVLILSLQTNFNVIETGLSDFHRLTVTIMKTSFQMLGPKIINCRTYKYFDNEDLRKDLLVELNKYYLHNIDCIMRTRNKYEPKSLKSHYGQI